MIKKGRKQTMKDRLKTMSFWLGISGIVVIISEAISNLLNISIVSESVEGVVVAICSVLVLLGFVTKKMFRIKMTHQKKNLWRSCIPQWEKMILKNNCMQMARFGGSFFVSNCCIFAEFKIY